MTHLDQMITDALAQSPDTVVHQLASEVVKLADSHRRIVAHLPGLELLYSAKCPEDRNYSEAEVATRDGVTLVITVQRKDRKTPHALRREAEAEVVRLRAEAAAWKADGMPKDRDELQRMLNDARRVGNQAAHDAHEAAEIADLKRGGVVVPEWDEEAFASAHATPPNPSFEYSAAMRAAKAGYKFAASRLRTIPADRVLGEGEVAVDSARLAALESIAAKIEALALGPDGRAWTPLHYREFARGELRAALRAQPTQEPTT